MKLVIKIKNRCSGIFGKKFKEKLISLYLHSKDKKGNEHYEKLGPLNKDKTIYCIRRRYGEIEGLLSIFSYVMGRIDYADRNGFIPFVDVDYDREISMFDKYFKVKNNLTREEVYNSEKVLFTGYDSKPVYPGWCNFMNTDFGERKRALFDKYIEIRENIVEEYEKQKKVIEPEKCLGLYLRGTDYVQLKPSGHPIQPTLEDVKDKIDEIMKNQNLKYIFLVTEDKDIHAQVEKEYPGIVRTVNNDMFFEKTEKKDYVVDTISKTGKLEENNIIYLVKTMILADCTALVAGRTNGSSVATALNGDKYKEKFIYNVGFYK